MCQRWRLLSRSSQKGVRCIAHGEPASYCKVFFVGGRPSNPQVSTSCVFHLHEDAGALEMQVDTPLAILGDEPDAVTDATDIPEAECLEDVSADRETT